MPAYTYRGRDAALTPVSGTMEAESPAAVVQQLVAMGVVVIDVNATRVVEVRADTPSWWDKLRAQPIRDDDVILFTRQMHTLQRTAVPIMRALAGLQE